MKYEFRKDEHLHLLDGRALTGTSSVSGVLAKNLTWWAAELAAVECLEVGEKIPTIREEYLEAAGKPGLEKKKAIDALCKKYPVFKAARFAHFAKKNDSAKKGTDLHSELEHFVRSEMGKTKEKDFDPKIQPFIDWSRANVEQFIASEANCYSERLWVGGIVDCVARMKDGKLAIVDFKSAKAAYTGHFIQCAGYAIQIEENGLFNETGTANKKLEGKIEKLIVVPFGSPEVVPEVREFLAVDEFKKGFEQATFLYRLIALDETIKEN